MPRLDVEVVPVTIPNGGSLSGAAKIGLSQIVGLDVPTIDSATLSFQVSADGVTYRNAYDAAGAEVTTGAANTGNRFLAAPASVAAAAYVKVRSGTGGTPVNQGADRTITLICK